MIKDYKTYYEINAPDEIQSLAINTWESLDRQKSSLNSDAIYRRRDHVFDSFSLAKPKFGNHSLYRDVRWPIKPDLIEFFVGCRGVKDPSYVPWCYKGQKVTGYWAGPHIDRGRRGALNIPVDVDIKNSRAFFGKHNDYMKYKSIVSNRETYFELDDENFYYHSYKKAALFNPLVPHGGENFGRERVLLTVSFFKVDYEYFVDKMFDSWS